MLVLCEVAQLCFFLVLLAACLELLSVVLIGLENVVRGLHGFKLEFP